MTITNKNTNFLNFPQMLGAKIEKDFPGLYQWFTYLSTFISTQFATQGDVTCLTAGTGLVVIGDDGKKYRVGVDSSGHPKATLV